MKITKKTIYKALRTFLQTFFGTAITLGTSMNWLDIDFKQASFGILVSSVFSGLAAIGMNLESEDNNNVI